MEIIHDLNQIEQLKNNCIKADGKNISFVSSEIRFKGGNNLCIIEDNVQISNSKIIFMGNNAIVYISRSNSRITMDCICSNESVVFLGENLYINPNFDDRFLLSATERENIIIGRDCLFSYGICMRTADPHIVYDCDTKRRINLSKSILIGDHVWVGQNVLFLKGSEVGSGSIVGANSVVANKKIPSNCSIGGNPCKVLRENVFFTRKCVHDFGEEDTCEYMKYNSDEYIYKKNDDNLNFEILNGLLKEKNVDDKLKFIMQVLVNNSCKDRFYMEKKGES